MKLSQPGACIFVPDGQEVADALARTTHLGVVAHPDDLEIVAWPAIRECFGRPDQWFAGVVITDGAGAPRAGKYGAHTNAQMREIRRGEQKTAARVGEYGAVVLLDHTSAAVKSTSRAPIVQDLQALLEAARPATVYTHNLADRHDTHVAAALAAIEACRTLTEGARPSRVLGGEVWRDLDWLVDADKIAEDAGGREDLAARLIATFESQIAGGKRHDLAVLGRRRAHATFQASHAVDTTTSLCLAMDLTPLVRDPDLDPLAYAQGFIERFAEEVRERMERLQGKG
jgi:LmbE family N-acetylglucosaminyl deacetylase